MPDNYTIFTYIHAIGMRSLQHPGTNTSSTAEDIRLNGDALPMGSISTSQYSIDTSDYSSFQAGPITAHSINTSTSNPYNRSEGPTGEYSPSIERRPDYDLEAQINGQLTDDDNEILPGFFRRWEKHHYAGIATILLVLHIVRSVYTIATS
jgi:hypothetical protein